MMVLGLAARASAFPLRNRDSQCSMGSLDSGNLDLPPPPRLHLRCSVLVVVDAVKVNLIMGAGMDSLVVDVVEVNVIMGAGMHSLGKMGGRGEDVEARRVTSH